MKIIAGLGNPGTEYARTKHNVGFMFVDALADALGVTASEWQAKFDALVAPARIDTEKVLLVKPQTYMNESGRALGPLLAWYKLAPEDLIVAHDDMDIPVGTIVSARKAVPVGIMASSLSSPMSVMNTLHACALASAVLCRAGRLSIMCWPLSPQKDSRRSKRPSSIWSLL